MIKLYHHDNDNPEIKKGIFINEFHDSDPELNWNVSRKPDPAQSQEIIFNADKVRFNVDPNDMFIGVSEKITMDSPEVTFQSNEINLGLNASEPLVLGNQLLGILNELISAIQGLTVGTAVGPSSPPINIPQFTAIQSKLNKILSKKNKTL